VDIAPDPAFDATMLEGIPLALALAVALDLDASVVDQQVQRAVRTAGGDVDLQGLLTPLQRAEVRHIPVQADQPQQALDEPSRLPQRHPDQHLHRQTGPDSGVAVVGLPSTLANGGGSPGHGGVQPDRQRATALQRFVAAGPVPGLEGGGVGLLMCPSYHAGVWA